MKFLLVASFLAICALALAAPSHHHHDKHHGSSYSVVTKHDDSHHHHHHHGWEEKKHHHEDEHKHDDHHDKHAKYEFEYGVKDWKTGDIKNQWEQRDGGHVKGSYSLKEADGTTRIVEYSADDHEGFNAVVKNIGHPHHHSDDSHHGHEAHSHGHGHGHVHGHGHGHGHATSYVKVKQD